MTQRSCAWTKVTIIGLGSQAKAWASNLRDSNLDIEIFLRPNSPSTSLASKLCFNVCQNLAHSDVLVLLIPDDQHLTFLQEHSSTLKDGTTIIYAHGASMIENELHLKYPHLNHALLAPKAIASELRFQFENHGKLGACFSVEHCHEDIAQEIEDNIITLASKIGITAGPFAVSFADEARADLFSEQSLLCGLIPYAARQCFDKLIQMGISPELAYMESWLEVKLIADAMVKKGPSELFELISPHALLGAENAKDYLFDKGYHKAIERIRTEIWDGTFFQKASTCDFKDLRHRVVKDWRESLLQQTHEKLKKDLRPQ